MNPLILILARSIIILSIGMVLAKALSRKGPAYAVACYKATLIALVATIGLSQFLFPISRGIQITIPPEKSVSLPAFVNNAPLAKSSKSRLPVIFRNDQQSTSLAAVAPASPNQTVRFRPSLVILGIWGLVSAFLLLRILISDISLRRLKRRSTSLSFTNAYALLQQIAELRGLAAPDLATHLKVGAPCLAGIYHPTIYLPEPMIDAPTERLTAIFEHELVHLRNHDCFWRGLERMLCALVWPNPLLWYICARLDEISEELCDQVVLRNGCERRAYAATLLELAQPNSLPPISGAVTAGVADFRSNVGQRIARVLNGSQIFVTAVPKRAKYTLLGSAILVSLASAIWVNVSVKDRVQTYSQADLPYAFAKDSDPAAIHILVDSLNAYRNLNSFKAKDFVRHGSSTRSIAEVEYVRPGTMKLIITSDIMGRTRVYVSPDSVETLDDSVPGKYEVFHPGDLGWDQRIGAFQEINNFAHFGPSSLSSMLEKPLPSRIPNALATAIYLGRKNVDGQIVDEVQLNVGHLYGTAHTLSTTYLIRAADHMIVREENVYDTRARTSSSEEFSDIQTNPSLTEEDVTFIPEKGMVAIHPQPRPQPEPEAARIYDQMTATYRGLRSISFVDHMGTSQDGLLNNGTVNNQKADNELDIAVQNPGEARADLKLSNYPSQSQTVVERGGHIYASQAGNTRLYIQREGPKETLLNFGGLGQPGGGMEASSQIANAVFGTPGGIFQRGYKVKPSESIDGQAMDVIGYNETRDTAAFSGTLYIGREDHLLHRETQSMSSLLKGRMLKDLTVDNFTYLSVNKPLPESLFEFKPPAGAIPTDDEEKLQYNGLEMPKYGLGDPFPSFSGKTLDGQSIALDLFKGKVVLIYAWTQGVSNNKYDLAKLQKLANKYADKGFVVVGITDDNQRGVEKRLKQANIQFPQVDDGRGISEALHVHLYPYSYLLDRKGTIIAYRPNLDDGTIERALDE